MNQSFYIGAVGAQQYQHRMNVQGDNMANVNTYGFKASSARFASLLYQDKVGIDDAQLPFGQGSKMMMTSTDFSSGAIVRTGRDQDYFIEGDGFFALADLRTGEITFTRNGAFSMAEHQRPTQEVDENGAPIYESVFCLSDGHGRFVLDEQGAMIEMTDPHAPQSVGIFDYSNYDGMLRLDGSRFLPVDKNGGLMRGTGKLIRGSLELSNVDLADTMVKVIESQRAYSMALRMVQTSDEVETTINGLYG